MSAPTLVEAERPQWLEPLYAAIDAFDVSTCTAAEPWAYADMVLGETELAMSEEGGSFDMKGASIVVFLLFKWLKEANDYWKKKVEKEAAEAEAHC